MTIDEIYVEAAQAAANYDGFKSHRGELEENEIRSKQRFHDRIDLHYSLENIEIFLSVPGRRTYNLLVDGHVEVDGETIEHFELHRPESLGNTGSQVKGYLDGLKLKLLDSSYLQTGLQEDAKTVPPPEEDPTFAD